MIIETKEPQPTTTPPDAPPAYDEIRPRSPSRFQRDEKTQRGDALASSSPVAGPSNPRSPTTPKSFGGNTVSSSNTRWSALSSWFGEKDTRREVKRTIQALMRDVVKESSSPASISVVQSCLEACQARGVSFESIVSEKFIEGHSPLYWAIVKLPPLSHPDDDQVRLLDILLSFPLNATTRSEAYLACLLSSDQVLFQRLRNSPGFQSPSVSGATELLLGDVPRDTVVVENQDGNHGEFQVNWKIEQFQKRMRVVGGIGTEFVARGRIWCLAFAVATQGVMASGTYTKAGSWVASVSLLSPSPPTHLEAQLSITEPLPSQDVAPRGSSPHHSPPPLTPSDIPHDVSKLSKPSTQTREDSRFRWPNLSREAQRPSIRLPVKTETMQLEALSPHILGPDIRDHVLGFKSLIVSLGAHPNGDSLQFDGCTYVNPDGSLSVTFDARLAKSNDGECIIC